ncbi:MAG: VCBS repeat-containing protein [Saprospiraceae bacterium]|nr:VCBS repeat-containing protein [Lewinella sp.]
MLLYLPIIFSFCCTFSASGQPVSFAVPVDLSAGTVAGISALDVADFNQDGLMDVAVLEGGAHAGGRVTLAWFEMTSEGTWLKHEFGAAEDLDDFIGSARCTDVDGDGDPDLVFTNDGHTSGPLHVFYLDNPGKEKCKETWPRYLIATIEGFHANDMRVADMDGDGKTDVVIRHKSPEACRILFQIDKTSWFDKLVYSGQAGEGLAVGDIDQDGLPDITMTGHWFKTPAEARLGQYRRYDIDAAYKTINKGTKEEIGDINGDGRPDVVISPAEAFPNYGGADHDLAWYECPIDPLNSDPWIKHIIKANYNNAHCVKLADFDGDGDPDILSAVAWEPRSIRIYFNDHGLFENSILLVSGNGIYSGAIADMDGDGDLDVVGEDQYAHSARPWYYECLLK